MYIAEVRTLKIIEIACDSSARRVRFMKALGEEGVRWIRDRLFTLPLHATKTIGVNF